MEAEERPPSPQGALDRRRERADICPVIIGELCHAPSGDRAVNRVCGGVGWWREQPCIGVAHHDRTASCAQPCNHRAGLRAERGDIAEADQFVDALAFEFRKHGVERDAVAVNVGDQSDVHRSPSPKVLCPNIYYDAATDTALEDFLAHRRDIGERDRLRDAGEHFRREVMGEPLPRRATRLLRDEDRVDAE